MAGMKKTPALPAQVYVIREDEDLVATEGTNYFEDGQQVGIYKLMETVKKRIIHTTEKVK